jgi:hypothetical protein
MKKHTILLTTIVMFCAAFTNSTRANSNSQFTVENLSFFNLSTSLNTRLYEGIGLAEYGLNREALDYAVKGYENLLDQGVVSNMQYLTVIDFSQPSFSRRFYLIDVENQELVMNTFVMHGKNSGFEMPEKFSNKINSNQSSLGFYVTKNPYTGKRGYSLRLAGLEKEFNSNAEARGVVLHGSKFINEDRANNKRVERSLGCPAIPQDENKDVINMIKEGSVIFIYHPSEEYLQRSAVLNAY